MILRILNVLARAVIGRRGPPAAPFEADRRVRPGAYALLGGVAQRH